MRASSLLVVPFVLAAAVVMQPAHGQPPPPGYGRGPVITCESHDGRFNRCALPWRGGAQLVQQISDSACVRGQTWGVRRGEVWVDQGCRGRFAPAGYEQMGWEPPRGWDHRFGVSCGSEDYHYNFCQVDVGRHGRVFLQRQTSGSACVEGNTWGWNRAGVWVDRGCAGNFVVDRRW